MTREYLEKHYILSSYNEDTPEQLDYYIDENSCEKGDLAFLYSYEEDNEEDRIQKLRIVKIIRRSDNPSEYNDLIKDNYVLLNGEDYYGANTSAEFITDNDCYLVWFEYMPSYKSKKTAKNTNELLDHLIKLLESDDKRFSFEWASGGENISMEIFDKDKKIGYLAKITPMGEDFD